MYRYRWQVIFGKNQPNSRYFCCSSPEILSQNEHAISDTRSYGNADFDQTEYYFQNGLRKVNPYPYTYTTICRNRWIGRKLLNVYKNEFGAYTEEVYVDRIFRGLLKVNNEIVKADYKLKRGDFLSSKVHRHEGPVLASPVKIIYNENHVLVVDKPCSVPVHPCGVHMHNSLLFILAKEHGIKNLFVNHRLDRLTSGVTIFAHTREKCREIHMQMDNREVRKRYLARVVGEFPDGAVTCDRPLSRIHNKIGVSLVEEKGSHSVTEFQKLSYNGKSSVVLCKPLTGRMHQIRVHLQYLGYPISNDPLYNSKLFGPNKGKDGKIEKEKKQLLEDLNEEHLYKKVHYKSNLQGSVEVNKNQPWFDSNCFNCLYPQPDPTPENLTMYLHAFEYEGKDWKYETDWPAWAHSTWTEP